MSREEAIEETQNFMSWLKPDSRIYKALKMAISAILEVEELVEKMPPVTPSRHKGHWILKQQGDRYADYYCSECGNELNLAYCTIKDEQKKGRCLYCDHCGAEMNEKESENDR